uniref:Zincin n=1 Tax=Parastrongyloides trichosuri TaxID=131310 RepID=A0A0N4Z1X9_PARTI
MTGKLLIFLYFIHSIYGYLFNAEEFFKNNFDTNTNYDVKNFTIRIPEIIFNSGRIIISKIDVSADQVDDLDRNNILPFYNHKDNETISYQILSSSINRSINPCDNFYNFVCDGWIKNHHVPEFDMSYDRLTDVQYTIYGQLETIIRSASKSDDRIDQMISILYNKCLDPMEDNRYGTSLVFYKLQEMQFKRFKYLTDFLIYIYPRNAIFQISVGPDFYNSSINRIYIEATSPSLHYEYFINKENNYIIDMYKKYLASVMEIFVNDDINNIIFKNGLFEIPRRVNSILKYQEQLAILANKSSSDSHTEDESLLLENVTIEKLQRLLPSINWLKYFQNILPQKVLDKVKLNETIIYLQNKNNLIFLDKLLHKLDRRTISDILDWIIIFNYYYTLDDRFKALDLQFTSVYSGIKNEKPKAIECLEVISDVFSDAIDIAYVKRFFNNKKKVEVEEMVKNILATFSDTIDHLDWMDEKTKSNAIDKVQKMIINVGYSDTIFNTTKLYTDFGSLSFTKENPLPDINEKIAKWRSDIYFENLIKINNRNSKTMPSFISNAYYLPYENTIGILAGALQNGFYESKHIIPLNYGGIGSVIGHEITHGFDDSGSQYDGIGNFKKWWDEGSKEKFLNKTDCFVKMYSNVLVKEVDQYLDGYITQGENIADDGGIRVAFKAMRKALELESINKNIKVKGLEEFDNDQLFFINYAFNWCSVDTKEGLKFQIREEVHTIPKYRVNVLLRNNEDFRVAFNCESHDNMVNDQTCRIF